MTQASAILGAHPKPLSVDKTVLVECADACFDCAQACTACADACLGEDKVQNLVRCIRTDLDCADICTATGHIISRQSEPDIGLIRQQLEACAAACRSCAAECDKHASKHEHCNACAESCRRCEQSCQRLLGELK